MQGVDLSKMVDAGKLDEVRAEVGKSYQQRIDELTSQLETLNKRAKNLQSMRPLVQASTLKKI